MLLLNKSYNRNSIKYFCKYACEVGKIPQTINLHKDIWKSSSSIRSSFINYFEKFDHKLIPSCSVRDIDGSYFVNSGVCQFKNHILGNDSQFNNVSKAVNSQRCIRLGGKMCDLESIGYDSTHLSYFEMLGNWSFRMYDKETACKLMWEYLTECLQLPSSHLYVTYFGGCEQLGLPSDEETRDIWFNLGVKDNKILQFGLKDNFWEMGDRVTNPICGPCTEIHWDYLATIGNSNEPRCARCFVNSGSPELVELWNCVFMQYRWTENGSKLVKLPGLVVDTGMGLERLTSVIQGVTDVYGTDNFSQIIDHISHVSKAPKYQGTFSLDSNNPRSPKIQVENFKDSINLEVKLRQDTAYRIIADHLRTLCVSIYDGILPGRQFVELKVRHLLHRAIRQSKYGLGMTCGLSSIIDTVCDTLQGQISVNSKMRDSIKKIVETEENNFFPKLEKYEMTFENFLNQRQSNEQIINETEINLLMDGYFGDKISLDMIRALSKDAGFQINTISDAISEPRVLNKLKNAKLVSLEEYLTKNNIPTTNSSYIYNYFYNDSNKLYETEEIDTEVVAIVYRSGNNENLITETKPIDNTEFGMITSSTNMYPFKGGQDSDKGVVILNDNVVANINNVIETDAGHVVHWCELVNTDILPLNLSTKIKLRVDPYHRTGTTLHHTAHHILFEGINNFLGKVNQASSLIKFDEGKFGFSIDFSKGDVSVLEDPNFISKLQDYSNNIIGKKIPIKIQKNVEIASILQDTKIRYIDANRLPNKVQVVSIGETGEVCCGTHAYNSGHLDQIIITSFSKVNQAISYVEFVTGKYAVDIHQKEVEYLKLISEHNIESYWINEKIDDIIYKLNTIIYTEKVSKLFRNQVQLAIYKLKKLKRVSPGLSVILKNKLIEFKDSHENTFIVRSNLFGVRKAVEILVKLNLSFPVMIHDDSKILIHIPKRNASEFMPNLLENIDKSVNECISEIPKTKAFDQNVLSQYCILTFANKIDNIVQLKKNFEELTKFIK